jgi:hypothetical protein
MTMPLNSTPGKATQAAQKAAVSSLCNDTQCWCLLVGDGHGSIQNWHSQCCRTLQVTCCQYLNKVCRALQLYVSNEQQPLLTCKQHVSDTGVLLISHMPDGTGDCCSTGVAPGWRISMKVSRCMRSFSASSSSVLILQQQQQQQQ